MFKFGAITLSLVDLVDFDLENLKKEVDIEIARRKGPVTLDNIEQCLVRCGQHIQAIKAYRARTGAGLRDSKDACDVFRNTIPDYRDGKTLWSDVEGRWTRPGGGSNW